MIKLYTDGSCAPNPGPGGYSVIRDSEPVALGFDRESTNIRMEAMALIAALKYANGEICEIHTDSQFWINVVTVWSIKWRANGWKKSNGPIMNLDLVMEICELFDQSNAKLVWVKAHNGTAGNELADEWANRARQQKLSK